MSTIPPNFTLLQVTPELETGGAEQTTIDIAAAVVAAGGRGLVQPDQPLAKSELGQVGLERCVVRQGGVEGEGLAQGE